VGAPAFSRRAPGLQRGPVQLIATAVIVTRGDVDLTPVLESLEPVFGERIVVWDNSKRPADMRVYGYFTGMGEVGTEYVYTQADDTIVDAQALLDAWTEDDKDRVLLNVADGDTPWISFGAVFRKDLAIDAISTYLDTYEFDDDVLKWCEVILLNLVPWRNIDLGKKDLPWHVAANRMCVQPDHYSEQARVRAKTRRLLAEELAA
jgi:hypothetical protein